MNPKIKKIIISLREEKLTDRERVLLRDRIQASLVKRSRPSPSPFFSYIAISASVMYRQTSKALVFSHKRVVPIALVFALVFLTGGTSFAAESSLPGDILYPIKINVNEQVVDFTRTTPKASAEWAITGAERRLDEATALSLEGRLNDSTQKEVQDGFNKKASQVKTRVAALASGVVGQTADAESLATSYASSLKTHEIVLAKISAKNGSQVQTKHIKALIGTLKTELATTTAVQTAIQAQIIAEGSSTDATGKSLISTKLTAVQDKLTTLKTDFSNATGTLSTSTSIIVVKNIQSTVDIISQTKASLNTATSSILSLEVKTTMVKDLGRALQLVSDAESMISLEKNASVAVQDVIKGSTASGGSTDSSATSTIGSISGTQLSDRNSNATSTGTSTVPSDIDIDIEAGLEDPSLATSSATSTTSDSVLGTSTSATASSLLNSSSSAIMPTR